MNEGKTESNSNITLQVSLPEYNGVSRLCPTHPINELVTILDII